MASKTTSCYSMGSGEDGQLGIGSNEEKEWVRTITSLSSNEFSSVVAGSRNSLAICEGGKDVNSSFVAGGNEYGQCGEEPECKADTDKLVRRDIVIPQRCVPKLLVRQVVAGGAHTVILTREGHVWTWGQPWPPGDMYVPVD
ncbi:unnamed protein product [Fraxinus pennsylvanica]|uniref:Uncharacterized protein n=1 Tax=Fraxinus pennsylvanica TaxID=56036 RepID=A0AAD1ZCH8_9LAMI|nr:unnamed protein product [Fraxinus pennsylvanica]